MTTRMPVHSVRIPDPLWSRLEEAARAVSDREGRTVSASELLRRLIDREYPEQRDDR